MAFKTWVARFVVDHGKVTEEGGRLRTFQRRRLDEPDVDLHIIAEPSGAKGDDLGMQALDAIGRVFLQDRRSLTGGLQQALRTTHQTLLDWNRRSVPREQVSIGVTAALVSGNLAFLTQAGPSVLYERRSGVLKRHTANDDYAQPALGEGELEPMMRRFELDPGDMLIAASPTLDELMDSAALSTLLDRGSEEALPELYLVTKELENFALFAVICTDEVATEETESLQHAGPSPVSLPPKLRELQTPGGAARRADSDALGRSATATEPVNREVPLPVAGSFDRPGDGFAEDGGAAAGRVSTAAIATSQHATSETAPHLNGTRARETPPVRTPSYDPWPASRSTASDQGATVPAVGAPESFGARFRGILSRVQLTKREATEPAPETPDSVMVAPRPVDISRSVVRLRSETTSNRNEYARTTGSPRRLNVNVSQPRFALLGAAVVLLIFIAVFAVPDLIRENRSERVASLIESAALQLQAAQAAQDPGVKRQELEEARRLAAEALRLESLNTTAADLRQQATNGLATLDAVVDLGQMTTLVSLSRQLTGNLSVVSAVVTPTTAYLLDSASGRVIAVPLASQAPPTTVFEENATYGGTPAKKPAMITWETSPTGGRLLVLDAERKLFELKPGSAPAPLGLRRSNTWSSVAAIAAYDGNLYVLDPKGNTVHRYLPAASGFDSEPTAAIAAGSNLADAEAMSVAGDIYISMKGGDVRRFSGGNDAGYALAAIDRPMKTITDVVALSTSQEVYFADSGNKRIVVGNREGAFVRQYVSNSFTDIRALTLDPSGSQLYVVVGDTLLTAPVAR